MLIFLKHEPDLYGSFFGAMLAGITPSFMPCVSARQDPGVYWSSHAELLRRIKPAAIVAARDTFEEMRASGLDLSDVMQIATDEVGTAELDFAARGEDEIALLQHSSGTTGLKKGVALSFRAIAAQADSYAESVGITPQDRIVHWLPLYHDMGLIACAIVPTYLGAPFVHIDPHAWVGRPDMLLDAMTTHRGTLTWMPNFAFEHMTNVCGSKASRYDLSSMRAFINCSEPCKPRAFDRFAQAFAPAGVTPEMLQCCYAMAETVFAVSQTRVGEAPLRIRVDPASLERGRAVRLVESDGLELIETGSLIDGIAMTALDEAGGALAEGSVGEIALSGDFLFSGYNEEPERTAQRLKDGVYLTSDLGFSHKGRLFVLGRTDDLIIVNGRNIYAHQVEAAISGVEGLKPGRSVAAPYYDPRVGSEVLVVIAERKSQSDRPDRDIRDDVLRIVQSTFNVMPQKVRVVDEGWLVKTTSGKISRTENLKKLNAGSGKATQ